MGYVKARVYRKNTALKGQFGRIYLPDTSPYGGDAPKILVAAFSKYTIILYHKPWKRADDPQKAESNLFLNFNGLGPFK